MNNDFTSFLNYLNTNINISNFYLSQKIVEQTKTTISNTIKSGLSVEQEQFNDLLKIVFSHPLELSFNNNSSYAHLIITHIISQGMKINELSPLIKEKLLTFFITYFPSQYDELTIKNSIKINKHNKSTITMIYFNSLLNKITITPDSIDLIKKLNNNQTAYSDIYEESLKTNRWFTIYILKKHFDFIIPEKDISLVVANLIISNTNNDSDLPLNILLESNIFKNNISKYKNPKKGLMHLFKEFYSQPTIHSFINKNIELLLINTSFIRLENKILQTDNTNAIKKNKL